MLYSALNFAAGFFGIPYEGQYLQSVTIEANGVSELLLPETVFLNCYIA